MNINFLYQVEDKLLGRDLKVVLRLLFGIIYKGSFSERQKFSIEDFIGDKIESKKNGIHTLNKKSLAIMVQRAAKGGTNTLDP